ncbi:protein HIGH CHLOROPHYLL FLUORESCENCE PHENOTYPE 173, chloroplastic-like [Triticum dicoccoides]|uniref:protein HIGH CHLOROPHYLL FLUORESCENCE PHENOTYPE 173, chloroplastic-like n=1 Tax=Triticum dicoccoides TaxID=85692 RepID=UPI000E7AFE5F|nr:protein HIGH CHLOROPHYLL FLUORESCENCE PHENOTYPE 173, chloroplastic-like [Triticum dicoccoides]
MVAAVSPPGAAGAATIIASFHGTHCASPSRAAAPRPRYHGSACCFAAKPTPAAAVASEPGQDQDVEDEGGVLGAANGADATPSTRKKRRARKGKRAAAALQQEAAEEEARRKAEEEEAAAKKKKAEEESRAASLDLDEVMAVSPVGLGRRSRQLFDEVWRKFSRLGQMSSASATEALAEAEQAVLSRGGPMCEFTVPGAQDTTVLVVGATSRIGRIVVRKLMLRGYNVKALVRRDDADVIDMLPRSVDIAVGDVGDPLAVQSAVSGCSKIIYCATARSTITGDLNRVDNQGVRNVSKAFQDYYNEMAQLRAGKSSKSKLLIAKFKSAKSLKGWEVNQGSYFPNAYASGSMFDEGIDASFDFSEGGQAVFAGFVFTRGGYVEISKRLSLPLGSTLDRYDGLLLSVGGNGRSYVVILETGPLADTSQSKKYFARMTTKVGFCRVRVPFSAFRPVKPEDPPLDPFLVHTFTIRFEPKRQRPGDGTQGATDPRNFELILEYIKALPTGQETDFILVSCTGSGIEPNRREQVLKAKKAGEDALRRSGLGYTIVRPGPLQEEPGGQRALIFDQGNRISQAISCADVADICVKALHDSTARNKSFDVCYEYVSEQGNELYELVAHLPDKANNYLTPALSVLEKNT